MVLMIVLVVGFMAHLAVDLGREVPVHVLQVDRFGRALLHGPLPDLSEVVPSRFEIQYALGEFIERARGVPTDRVAMERELTKAYAWLGPRARAFADDWYQHNNPYERSDSESVTVEVTTILSEDPQLERWTVEWEEAVRRGGTTVRTEQWRALITIGFDPDVRDRAQLFNNPWGIQIVHLDWSRKFTETK
ncbi:MAG: type IV secretion system protein [Acidobacteria bacterium]|nr:type IV secretion system protein [Acidobacteriota bacterium]